MTTSKPKTLEDLPKFSVTAVRLRPQSKNRPWCFEVEGRYDPALELVFQQIHDDIGVKWFYLLYGHRGYLLATLKSFDKQTKTATVTCNEKQTPEIFGLDLAYLSPYWWPQNVWMVLDPDWGWKRKKYIATGWGHEYCDLCHRHINGGEYGYCDPNEKWMCTKCYKQYVAPHDLAFVGSFD